MNAFELRRARWLADTHRQVRAEMPRAAELLRRRRESSEAERGVLFRVCTYEAARLRKWRVRWRENRNAEHGTGRKNVDRD